jgi:hypothetical protein
MTNLTLVMAPLIVVLKNLLHLTEIINRALDRIFINKLKGMRD